MMAERILLVEDDADLAEVIASEIRTLGYEVDVSSDGKAGLARALGQTPRYALVVLDIMLPSLSGLEICDRLRQEQEEVPILMLTSRGDDVDKLLGLHLGADDYMVKPFDTRELVARTKALLRRSRIRTERELAQRERKTLSFEKLEIHLNTRKVFYAGKPIELTSLEFDLLAFLASSPGQPFSREELAREVWGYESSAYLATVSTHLSRLRSKIEPDPENPRFVITLRGVGYRFAEPDEAGGA